MKTLITIILASLLVTFCVNTLWLDFSPKLLNSQPKYIAAKEKATLQGLKDEVDSIDINTLMAGLEERVGKGTLEEKTFVEIQTLVLSAIISQNKLNQYYDTIKAWEAYDAEVKKYVEKYREEGRKL